MIVTLIHIGESWWWEKNMCLVECSDGRKVDPRVHMRSNEGMVWEVHDTDAGIEGRYFHVSSGQGKQLSYTRLLIPRSAYTKVVHKGQEPSRPPDHVVGFVKREMNL